MRSFLKHTPSLHSASQSLLDCSEAAGLVTSMSGDWLATGFCRPSAAEQVPTVHAKVVERFGNLDLGLEVKVGIGKLLALS